VGNAGNWTKNKDFKGITEEQLVLDILILMW
jgi:hypothetical protein